MRQCAGTSRTLFRPRRGTEVIELALLLLPLMWLTFGAVDFGYYFYLEHNVEAAAREGVRAGIVPGAGYQQINAAVDRVMENSGITKGYSWTKDVDKSDPNNWYLTVSVTMPYTPMGVPPARVPNHSVIGEATMRLE